MNYILAFFVAIAFGRQFTLCLCGYNQKDANLTKEYDPTSIFYHKNYEDTNSIKGKGIRRISGEEIPWPKFESFHEVNETLVKNFGYYVTLWFCNYDPRASKMSYVCIRSHTHEIIHEGTISYPMGIHYGDTLQGVLPFGWIQCKLKMNVNGKRQCMDLQFWKENFDHVMEWQIREKFAFSRPYGEEKWRKSPWSWVEGYSKCYNYTRS